MVHAVSAQKKDRRKVAGFSFIELVVAITIMAILATLVAPKIFKFVGQTKELKTTTSLKAIKNAIMFFHNDTGQYPNTLMDLVFKPADPKLGQRWKGEYLEEKDIEEDGWKNEFVYHKNSPGSKHPYELHSWGPNGEGSPQGEWIDAWSI